MKWRWYLWWCWQWLCGAWRCWGGRSSCRNPPPWWRTGWGCSTRIPDDIVTIIFPGSKTGQTRQNVPQTFCFPPVSCSCYHWHLYLLSRLQGGNIKKTKRSREKTLEPTGHLVWDDADPSSAGSVEQLGVVVPVDVTGGLHVATEDAGEVEDWALLHIDRGTSLDLTGGICKKNLLFPF